jgi:hypothetical protein
MTRSDDRITYVVPAGRRIGPCQRGCAAGDQSVPFRQIAETIDVAARISSPAQRPLDRHGDEEAIGAAAIRPR